MPDWTDTPGEIARRQAAAIAEVLDWEKRHPSRWTLRKRAEAEPAQTERHATNQGA